MWLRVVVRGVSGHSAVRYRSVHAGGRGTAVNAIEKAVKILVAVQELERHWGNTKVHPLMPKGITTINPGVVAGGSAGGADGMPNSMAAYSTMPDYCALGLSLKFLPDERVEDVRHDFEDYVRRVADADPWLREHPPEIEWSIGGVTFPPSELALDHPLAIAVADAHRRRDRRARVARLRGRLRPRLDRAGGHPGAPLRPRRRRARAFVRRVRRGRRSRRLGEGRRPCARRLVRDRVGIRPARTDR